MVTRPTRPTRPTDLVSRYLDSTWAAPLTIAVMGLLLLFGPRC